MNDFLSFQEFQSPGIRSNPIDADAKDELVLVLEETGVCSIFNSKTQISSQLSIYDKSITSKPLHVAISPSKSYAAISYEDGSFLIYDLNNSKILKSFPKARKSGIKYLKFLGDSQLVILDSANFLSLSRISISLFGVSTKDIAIVGFQNNPFSITPISFDNISAQNNPKLQNLLIVTTTEKFVIFNVENAPKIIVNIPVSCGIATYCFSNKNTIQIGIATKDMVSIYKFDGVNFNEITKYPVTNITPQSVTFLRNNLLLVLTNENQFYLFNAISSTSTDLCQFNFEQSIIAKNISEGTLLAVKTGSISKISQKTFIQNISNLPVDELLQLSEKYISGDIKTGCDAILHPDSKLEVLHSIFAKLFREKIIDRNRLFEISKRLSLKRLPSSLASDLFSDDVTLMAKLALESDPDATFFVYSSQLSNLICCSIEACDSFIRNIPSLTTTSLSEYYIRSGDVPAAISLLESADPAAAISLSAIAGSELYDILVNSRAISLTDACLCMKRAVDNDVLLLSNIAKTRGESDVRQIISFCSHSSLELNGRPFKLAQIVERAARLAVSLSSSEITKLAIEVALQGAQGLSDEATIFIARQMFEPDNESKIVEFLKANGSSQALQLISEPAKIAGFNILQEFIFRKIGHAEKLVSLLISQGKGFEALQAINECRDMKIVSNVLRSNAMALMKTDARSFTALFGQPSYEFIAVEVYKSLFDDSKFEFAYCIRNFPAFRNLPLNAEEYCSYTRFLMRHHKADVLQFLKQKSDVMAPSLLADFEHEKLFDCALAVSLEMDDPVLVMQNTSFALKDLLSRCLCCDDSHVQYFLQRAAGVIEDIRNYLMNEMAVSAIIKSFELPLFALAEAQVGSVIYSRNRAVLSIFNHFYRIVSQNFPFPILMTCLTLAFSDNGIGALRLSLPELIRRANLIDITLNDISSVAGENAMNIVASSIQK